MSQALETVTMVVTLVLMGGLAINELATAAGHRLVLLRWAVGVGMALFVLVMVLRLADLLA
jgi:hypothetical protein